MGVLLILLLLHPGNRSIIRLNINLALKTVNDDHLAFIIFLKRLSKSNDRGDSFRARQYRRMGIDRSIPRGKPQHLGLIQLHCLARVQFARRQYKRLIRQHLVFPSSGQNAKDTVCHIFHVCIVSLHIVFLLRYRI